MKQTVKNLLSIAGITSTNQKYMCAYYIQSKELKFLHVIECNQKENSFISPFGLPDGYSFTQSELDGHLKEWLKTNKAEKYEDRTPNERIADIYNFDTTIFKTK